MRSPAPKSEESEFDALLGQLTDELAMTPPSQSGVALVPDLEPPKVQLAATGRMAAEAAAAAGVLKPASSKPDNTIVKIVGIIAAALTVVSVAALVVLGQGKPETVASVEDKVEVAATERSEAEVAQRRAEREAHTQAMAAERAADQAEYVRIEGKRLSAQLAAQPELEAKPRKPRKPKKKTEVGGDFDEL